MSVTYCYCTNWTHGARCRRVAEVHLIAPDGERVRGCFYCRPCAQATVDEYAAKLGERWTLAVPTP